MKFLVDANLGRKFTNLIKNTGHDAAFINDISRNASDEDILILSDREKRIVISADKDFGELIFKSGKSSEGVILIRIKTSDPKRRFEMVKDSLDKAEGNFVVVEEGQTRVRKLK